MGAPTRNTRRCPQCGLSNRLPHRVPYDCELAYLLWNEQQAKRDAKRKR